MASVCKVNCSEQIADRQEIQNAASNGVPSATTIYRVDSHCSQLCQALFKLTTADQQFCDVTLKLHGANKEFKAHSPVLAACSAFFKGILDKPEHQHVKNVVIVLPEFIEAVGLEPLLVFIYTGDLGINRENIASIYQVSVLFELPAAVALCNKYVETNKLSPSILSSVCQVGHLSDRPYDDFASSGVPLDVVACSLEENLPDHTEESWKNSTENESLVSGNPAKGSPEPGLPDGGMDISPVKIEDMPRGVSIENNIVACNDHKSVASSPQDTSGTTEINGTPKPAVINIKTKSAVTRLKKGLSGHVTKKVVAKEERGAPIRRSMRHLAGQKRKLPSSNALLNKRNAMKRKTMNKPKAKIPVVKHKLEMRAKRTPAKPPKEEKLAEEPPAVLLPKIDPNLKFTDPAKYIAELIDKNSDMLSKPGSDNQGGGVKLATRGKITFIFPEGTEVALPPLDAKPPTPTTPDAKLNASGLPYEKIVDPLTCSECNLTFVTAVLREQHLEEKHSGLSNSTKQVMFQCLSCSFSTDFLRNMWFHCHWKHAYPLPDTLRQYCCGLCDYRAPAQGNIEVHIRRVHTHERPLMCDVCGQFFKSLDTLRGHRFYRHQDIFPFQCNVCEKQFKRRHKLDVHMRIHMGYKPFACPECQYATYTKFNLKDHMRKRHLKELDHVTTT